LFFLLYNSIDERSAARKDRRTQRDVSTPADARPAQAFHRLRRRIPWRLARPAIVKLFLPGLHGSTCFWLYAHVVHPWGAVFPVRVGYILSFHQALDCAGGQGSGPSDDRSWKTGVTPLT